MLGRNPSTTGCFQAFFTSPLCSEPDSSEASYDVAELEPLIRYPNTYALQEYFVPAETLEKFIPKMRKVFLAHDAQIINVSIRNAGVDPGSIMAWARSEVFSVVIYFKQGLGSKDRDQVGQWTRALIDAALDLGGTYYLPYQLHATEAQFAKAYPRAAELKNLKKQYDPGNRFRNKLIDGYLLSF